MRHEGLSVNMSGSGIGLSTWKITACWQVNSAAKKRIREGANSPAGKVRAISAQIFSRFLPVAHRGWMNPSRQLLHSCRLRRCKRTHRSLPLETWSLIAQTLQNRCHCSSRVAAGRPQPWMNGSSSSVRRSIRARRSGSSRRQALRKFFSSVPRLGVIWPLSIRDR